MSDKGKDSKKKTSQDSSPQEPLIARLRRHRAKLFILVLLMCGLGLLLFFGGTTPETSRTGTSGDRGSSISKVPFVGALISKTGIRLGGDLKPVILDDSLNRVGSAEEVLGSVGRSPLYPSKALFAALEESVLTPKTENPEACPPGMALPAGIKEDAPSEGEAAAAKERADAGRQADAEPGTAPRPKSEPEAEKSVEGESKPDDGAEVDPAPHTGPPAGAVRAEELRAPYDQSETSPEAVDPNRGSRLPPNSVRISAREPADDTDSAESPDPAPYRMPGSLVVNLSNYSGNLVKWRIMVILDDSAVMEKESKTWETTRMATAVEVVKELPKILTPGSELAVRDFYCNKSRGRRGRTRSRCLSHVLFEWSQAPFAGLTERLEAVGPYGLNDACAAAAFSARRDFGPSGGLAPRILIVTGGLRRCSAKKTVDSATRRGGGSSVRLDVVGIGMSRPSTKAYKYLTGKTDGIFLDIDRPSDVQKVLKRYRAILHTPTLEKMEVRGNRTVFKVANGRSITLSPGSYDLVLPEIKGLSMENRIIKNIKIESQESKVLNVKIRKGKALVRSAKK